MTQSPKLQTGGPMILTKDTDKLGYLEKVTFLKGFIETHYKEGGSFADSEDDKMIALYGGRGSGKSSIMKTLCEENPNSLDKEKFQTVFFEARKYEKDKNLALSLFHFLGQIIFEDKREAELTKKDSIFAGLRGLLGGFGFSIGGGNYPIGIQFSAEAALNMEDKRLKEIQEKLEQEMIKKESGFSDHKNLEKGFQKLSEKIDNGKKLLVFIDDLDRCDSENVINLLSAIKLFFTYSKDIIFIVGIDKKAIVRGLQVKYASDEEKAEEYLEKIFTINFSMKKNLKIGEFIYSYFSGGETYIEEIVKLFNAIGFTNPRHIKKLLNKFLLLKDTFELDDFGVEKDNNKLILFLYLAYLYEFEFNEFKNIKNKYNNWRKFVKIQNATYGISKGQVNEPMRYFLEKYNKEITIDAKMSGRFNHDINQLETIDYYGKNKDFIKYIFDKKITIEVESIEKIKKIIQIIR